MVIRELQYTLWGTSNDPGIDPVTFEALPKALFYRPEQPPEIKFFVINFIFYF